MSGQILILMNLWFSISNETLVWLRPVHGPFRWTSPKLSRDNLFINNFKEPDSQRSCDSMGSDSWHGSQEEESTSKCLFLFGTSGKICGFLVVKYFFYFRSWEIIACLCMRTAVQFYCYGSARRRKSKWYCTKEGFKISDRRARIGWTF